jgi:uncharacterized protein
MPVLLPDPWHFPRSEFADQILASLNGGLVNSIALFAPRRMGKTQFVLRDLLPAHLANGGDAIYFNLWENKSSPESVMIEALRGHIEILKGASTKKTGKIASSIDLAIVKFTAEYGEELAAKSPVETVAAAIRLWAEVLRAKKQTGLLVIDEVQHLATSDKFVNFTAALRTALEGSADCIKAVFTGSSQAGLTRMFYDTKAAFYGPGSQISLPRFGHDFIDFISAKASETYKQIFAIEDVAHVFELHNASPYFLRQSLNFAVLKALDLKTAARRVGMDLYVELGLQEKWDGLSIVEQIVVQCIYGKQQLYTENTRNWISSIAGEEVTARRIQLAVAKLERGDWIDKTLDGKYEIADPVVTAYIVEITDVGMSLGHDDAIKRSQSKKLPN